jgi:hypothetical protein
VQRARRVQRFLSQPFFVAEQFTGRGGKYVPLAETIRGFAEIIDGKHDDLPEDAFYMVGTIDEALEKAKEIGAQDDDKPQPAEAEQNDQAPAEAQPTADAQPTAEEQPKADDEPAPEAKPDVETEKS